MERRRVWKLPSLRVRPRHLAVAAVTLIGFSLLASGGPLTAPPASLDFDIASSESSVQLYWSSGDHFEQSHSIRLPLRAGRDFERVHVPLQGRAVRRVRLDTARNGGEILIRNMRMLDARGEVVRQFDASTLAPSLDVRSMVQEGDVTRIESARNAGAPYVVAGVGCAVPPRGAARLAYVTPESLLLAAAVVALFLFAALAAVAADAFGSRSGGPPDPRQRKLALAWLSVLFLAVFAARLLVMSRVPATVPIYDQWDAEARLLYVPAATCELKWTAIVALHNEHRIAFSRLLSLVLLSVFDQWDPRLQQLSSAFLHAAAAALLAAMFWTVTGRKRMDLLVLVAGMVFAVPFAWENAISAFQSAFFFLILFSILGLWLIVRARPGSWAWTLGWLCALAAAFSAAGGLLLPVAALLVFLAGGPGRHGNRRGLWLSAAAATVTLAIGIAALSPPVPYHASLKAQTASDFVAALARCMAWPWIDHPWALVIMWLPFASLATRILARGRQFSDAHRLTLGLGAWVLLQAGAVAYARGANGPPPMPRYQDFLALGFIANAAALLIWIDGLPARSTPRYALTAAAAAWLSFGAAGIGGLMSAALPHYAAWRDHFAAHEINVRRYVLTGEFEALRDRQAPGEIPHPSAPMLAMLLREPSISRILPSTVRRPLPLHPERTTGDAFVEGGASPTTPRDPLSRVFGSYAERGNEARGRFESRPAGPCTFRDYLQFPVAGYLGFPGLSLSLQGSRGPAIPVQPDQLARHGWRAVRVRCPAGLFVVTGVDQRSEYWFAFGEPVEISTASVAVEWLVGAAPYLLGFVLALTVVVARLT